MVDIYYLPSISVVSLLNRFLPIVQVDSFDKIFYYFPKYVFIILPMCG